MYQLCVLPLLGVPLAARQAFVGGDYELLSRFNSTAHPSFWVAYLYGQHLAGAATYQVSQSVSSVTTGLRVFGFVDAENAKIAVVLNANVSTTYQLQLPDFASAVLVQKLSADSLSSGQILLNGKPLMLIPTAGATELPATPWVNATNPLTVPPLTAFFVKSL
ncbi:hypothetical protein DIPPA_16854 [Diplonema papillatum]|nr:hypothetical protein DIPPA_16854 [Diplonema papillatum]